MKKISLPISALLLIGVIAFSSCKKEIKKTFDLNGGTLYFQTNAQPHTGNDMILLDSTVSSQLKQALIDNDIDMEKVTAVKLKTATLSIVDPSLTGGVTFDPFDYANAFITAGSKAQEQLAYISVIPHDGLTEFTMTPQAQDLKDFLKEDQLNLLLRAYNSTDAPAMDLRLDLKYEVEYNFIK